MTKKFMRKDEVLRDMLVNIVQRNCAAFQSPEATPLMLVKVDKYYVLMSHIHTYICMYLYV